VRRLEFYRCRESVARSSVGGRFCAQDIRATEPYREILQFCSNVRRSGTGQVSDGSQLQLFPLDCASASPRPTPKVAASVGDLNLIDTAFRELS
jgi:hypothetical protein